MSNLKFYTVAISIIIIPFIFAFIAYTMSESDVIAVFTGMCSSLVAFGTVAIIALMEEFK